MSATIANNCDNENLLKQQIKEMENTVSNLEANLKQSNQNDNKLIISLNNERQKYESLSSQLEEALKENRQLLEILQQKCGEQDSCRTSSQSDLSASCSTMSIVHLQYKYEELLSSHYGLLKLLDMKSEEIRKVNDENEQLKAEINQLKINLSDHLVKIEKVSEKYKRLKEKKDLKIHKLKEQKETLELVHNQLIDLLHKQFMEKDDQLLGEIKHCCDSEKAQLLQEIRKNNLLVYENFQINKQIELLRTVVNNAKKK